MLYCQSFDACNELCEKDLEEGGKRREIGITGPDNGIQVPIFLALKTRKY